jgi:type I restriction enzyme S subunit
MIRYEKYKLSGVEWLGEIPVHWDVKRVKEIANYISRGVTPNYVENGFCKVINQATFSKGFFDRENAKFTSNCDKKALTKLNDILIASTGGGVLGKTFFIDKVLGEFYTDSHVTTIRANNKFLISKYLYYFFSINYDLINALLAKGSTNQTELQRDQLLNFKWCLPSLPEQTAIVNYLDTKTEAIDQKIELLTAKTAKYNALRRSLINETVCRGLNPNALLKDSGIEWIGKIPAHWEVKRFKEIARTVKGKNLDLSDTYFDKSLPNLSLDFLRNDSITFDTFCYTTDKNQRVTTNDMIIIWDGAGVGEILKGKDGFLSSTIAKIVVDNKKYDKNFLYHLRFSIEYVLKMIPAGMGIPHLNPQVLNSFDCPCPPLIEQLEIAQYLDNQTSQIDTILSNISNQIGKLTQLRKTLINDVVTGKIKVTED